MDAESTKKLDRRLARVEGQVRGLRRMIAEGDYCIDVLTQVAAVRSALDQIGVELAAGHVKTCILGQGSETAHGHASDMSQDELVEELHATLSRMMR